MNMKFLYLLSISLIAVAASCNGPVKSTKNGERDKTEDVPKVLAASLVNMEEPADNSTFSSGEQINLRLGLRGEDKPDSVRVYFDGKAIATLEEQLLEYRVETGAAGLGKTALKIMAYKGDKRPQVITHFVTIISDIEPILYGYRVINKFPHDQTAYTQGLIYHNNYFYESTGVEGRSTLRKVEPRTGEPVKVHNVESKFFAEGLTMHDGLLFQLTWRRNVGFVYDLESLEEIRRFHYTMQGWGLTGNGEELILSDGTNKLYFLDPAYFNVLSSVEVYDDKDYVWQLNELEYINGEIWANIYMSDRIARIDPSTGKVLAYIDLAGILPRNEKHPEIAELNGIAWDEDNERLFVTGKNWPSLFEIRLVRKP